MRTLVVSDLHLGKAEANDLLRREELREPLLEALDGVDRFVILGDGLELREAPHRDAVEIAAPFFADLGRAGKEVIVLSGNHDHGLAAGWIDARLQSEPAGFLGLEQRFDAADAGPLARRLADLAPLRFAYPGIWLRDDVYAIHGHYADVHATVPTFERLAAGTMARFVAQLPAGRRHAGRLRGGPVPAVRVAARAHAARRPHDRQQGRRRLLALVHGADATLRPRAPDPDRLSRRGRRAQRSPASDRCSRACRRPRCAAAT